MQVLKKGRKQKGWAKEFECTGNGSGGCGARLLVEQKDMFVTQSHARDETTNYNTFKCCECGVLTDIKERIPFSAQSKKHWEEQNGKSIDDVP